MSADVRAEIDTVNSQFVDGAGRGDFEAMGGVYTEDARILPPGQPMIQGRAAIQEFWASAAQALGMTGVDLATEVLETQGDTAEEIGAYTIHGGGGVLDQGKYVIVWKRTDDWCRYYCDIWNSNKG